MYPESASDEAIHAVCRFAIKGYIDNYLNIVTGDEYWNAHVETDDSIKIKKLVLPVPKLCVDSKAPLAAQNWTTSQLPKMELNSRVFLLNKKEPTSESSPLRNYGQLLLEQVPALTHIHALLTEDADLENSEAELSRYSAHFFVTLLRMIPEEKKKRIHVLYYGNDFETEFEAFAKTL